VWRINFYAMKDNGGVAWSPILGQGNFHKASRFGRVTWQVAGAAAAPSGAPADAKAQPLGAGEAGGPRFMQLVHRPMVPKVPAVP
jgi:hypothetical protein